MYRKTGEKQILLAQEFAKEYVYNNDRKIIQEYFQVAEQFAIEKEMYAASDAYLTNEEIPLDKPIEFYSTDPLIHARELTDLYYKLYEIMNIKNFTIFTKSKFSIQINTRDIVYIMVIPKVPFILKPARFNKGNIHCLTYDTHNVEYHLRLCDPDYYENWPEIYKKIKKGGAPNQNIRKRIYLFDGPDGQRFLTNRTLEEESEKWDGECKIINTRFATRKIRKMIIKQREKKFIFFETHTMFPDCDLLRIAYILLERWIVKMLFYYKIITVDISKFWDNKLKKYKFDLAPIDPSIWCGYYISNIHFDKKIMINQNEKFIPYIPAAAVKKKEGIDLK